MGERGRRQRWVGTRSAQRFPIIFVYSISIKINVDIFICILLLQLSQWLRLFKRLWHNHRFKTIDNIILTFIIIVLKLNFLSIRFSIFICYLIEPAHNIVGAKILIIVSNVKKKYIIWNDCIVFCEPFKWKYTVYYSSKVVKLCSYTLVLLDKSIVTGIFHHFDLF